MSCSGTRRKFYNLCDCFQNCQEIQRIFKEKKLEPIGYLGIFGNLGVPCNTGQFSLTQRPQEIPKTQGILIKFNYKIIFILETIITHFV